MFPLELKYKAGVTTQRGDPSLSVFLLSLCILFDFSIFFITQVETFFFSFSSNQSDVCRTGKRLFSQTWAGGLYMTKNKPGSHFEFVNNGVGQWCGQHYRNWGKHFLLKWRAESERIGLPLHWQVAIVLLCTCQCNPNMWETFRTLARLNCSDCIFRFFAEFKWRFRKFDKYKFDMRVLSLNCIKYVSHLKLSFSFIKLSFHKDLKFLLCFVYICLLARMVIFFSLICSNIHSDPSSVQT